MQVEMYIESRYRRPKIAGWGCVFRLKDDTFRRMVSGYLPDATPENYRMAGLAAALDLLHTPCELTIITSGIGEALSAAVNRLLLPHDVTWETGLKFLESGEQEPKMLMAGDLARMAAYNVSRDLTVAGQASAVPVQVALKAAA